jgi:hypothetical protein
MKRNVIILSSVLLGLILTGFIALYIWIDIDVKKNIKIATDRYPGKAEDALIAYLSDTSNPPHERSHVAIWTLGQIRSEKALPVLTVLYQDDPEGKTCYGKHDSVLCQYEIYKAMKAINARWWPTHSRLNR